MIGSASTMTASPRGPRHGSTGWSVSDNPPTVLYHCTDKRDFSSIMKYGLVPGGGEHRETGRPHVYFADKPSTSKNYISGVRADRPLEIQVECRMAIKAGLVFFRTESDGILTGDKVRNYTILSVLDATNQRRRLVHALQAVGRSRERTGCRGGAAGCEKRAGGYGRQKHSPGEDCRHKDHATSPRASQGDAKRQKTFNPMENVELKCAKCPVRNNEIFEGQINCNTCGQLSPLNPRLLKDQQRNYIKRRSELLKNMGLSTNVTA